MPEPVVFGGMDDAMKFLRATENKELRSSLEKTEEFLGVVPVIADVVIALPTLAEKTAKDLFTVCAGFESLAEFIFMRGYQAAVAERARQFAEKL